MTPSHSEHLAGLLDALVAYLRGYVVMTGQQADAVALWTAHTHVLDAFETTPFLAVTSPEKRCGKSRLLDVLELIVARAWRTITPSEAVVYRKIAAVTPTLMLDETDAIFNHNGDTEPLRALLNAGNRRGTSVPRCVGPSQQLVDFPVFCPKALAGIGDLPDTITDRSIVIRMARKRPDETAQRFRRREALEIAEPIEQALASWAQDALTHLEEARPQIPDALDDRAEEAWEPLLAISELAGAHWPERARLAALELSAGREDDEALGVWLLRDIRTVFAEKTVDRLSSVDLAAALSEIEISPWGDIRGKALDGRALARRLKPFKVRPRTVRFDETTTASGYREDQFEDVFARYLGDAHNAPLGFPADFSGHTVTTAPLSQKQAGSNGHMEGVEMTRKPASANGCVRVSDRNLEGTAQSLLTVGEPGYAMQVDAAYTAGLITDAEHRELLSIDALVCTSRRPPTA